MNDVLQDPSIVCSFAQAVVRLVFVGIERYLFPFSSPYKNVCRDLTTTYDSIPKAHSLPRPIRATLARSAGHLVFSLLAYHLGVSLGLLFYRSDCLYGSR